MEASWMLMTVITFVGSEVARKISDEAMNILWGKLAKPWRDILGAEPTPRDVKGPAIEAVTARAPELSAALIEIMGRSPVLRRLRRVRDAVQDARILWLDDHPAWNGWEIACLEAVGARVRTVERTQTALALLREGYEVLISDVDREGNPTEGIAALPVLRRAAPATPVILYVGTLREAGVPAGAFGITNRPDDLLHLVLDVLERSRLTDPA
jgi:hypothetical protein